KTIIVSSHLLNEIEVIANKLLIIHKGKKIIEGTTKQLLDPAKTLVEFQTNNDAAAKEILLHSTWSNYLHLPGREKIILQVHKSLIPEVVTFMVSNHVEINAVNPRHSLEDYFLLLTNPVNHVASLAI
ncbi:MAG: ABC transporter ATP-binding protein, partial [Bacteroidota bacterium]|nr:ABC transporter ATP-binding protein [Bacteroidota bacterium]